MTTREPLHVTNDGEVPFLAPIAGVDPVEDSHFVTKGWGVANLGGGGGVTDGDKGDVVVSSSGATWTVDSNAITDAKLRDSAALSVVGRSANSSGDPADITATAASGGVLRESGSTIGFGTVATAGIADNAITNAKLRDSAALSVVGRSANSTGDPADIAAGSDHQVLRRSGTSIAFGQVNLAQSAAVTGALPIANGGTGSTSAGAALTALGAAAALHAHDGVDVNLDSSAWTGPLSSARPSTVQELADWIDANWPGP